MTDTESGTQEAPSELPGRALPDPRVHPTVSIEEAGRILGVSRPSAYAAARSGELPTIRLGRRLLVPTARLAELLGVAL